MIIVVGSNNQVKLEAVAEIIKDYPYLASAEIKNKNVSSGVSSQPFSLEETMTGAMNRAQNVFNDCDYSIGIESGLIAVPFTKTGYMDICVCSIYDGKNFFFGFSSAWEFPDKKIIDVMIEEKLDMSQALNKMGLTDNPNIGSEEGAIGILTKGRLTRKEYTKQALRVALIHLDLI